MVMYNSFEEIEAEGEAKGLAKGRVEGEAKGRVEGEAKGRVEGEAKGRVEGEAKGLAKSILTVLSVRGIAVSEAARTRILKEIDLERLQRWLVNAAVATSIEDVFDDPSSVTMVRY